MGKGHRGHREHGGHGNGGGRRKHVKPAKLEPGQQVLDRDSGLTGVILEFACQYAHPKAAPNYNYLVRWEDGQVNAFAEQALYGDQGICCVE